MHQMDSIQISLNRLLSDYVVALIMRIMLEVGDQADKLNSYKVKTLVSLARHASHRYLQLLSG